jgi:glutamate-5-semialdehyde dehydrogenase
MQQILEKAKQSAAILRTASSGARSAAIRRIGELIEAQADKLSAANKLDLDAASDLSAPMKARLTLDDRGIKALAASMYEISLQNDPIGQVLEGFIRPNGLKINKVRVPLGVVGIIYESRPNVTADCAALCLRSGNAAILRGGREAWHSNNALAEIIKEALTDTNLPPDAVSLLHDPDRSLMAQLLKAKNYVDLIVPRGGEGLINYVVENSLIPVVRHDKGVCHIYVDKDADFNKALNIIHNAKTTRPSACNAVEGVLVHKDIAASFLPLLAEKLQGVELRGDAAVCKIISAKPATEDDKGAEYLDLILSVRVADNASAAVSYINKYSSAHSDAVITEDYGVSQFFLDNVDSACVYVNASTRFTDGGEFGLGAEVGISNQKLHSRGPMGAFDLTTTKYIILGTGQVR